MQLPIPLHNIFSDLDNFGDWQRPVSAFVRPVLRDYQAKAPFQFPEAGSCSKCYLNVDVFGYDFSNCSSNSYMLDLDSVFPNSIGYMTDPIRIFQISISGPTGESDIQIDVTRKVSATCEDSQFITTTCWSTKSLVTHGMLLNESNATFVSDWRDDSFALLQESQLCQLSTRLCVIKLMLFAKPLAAALLTSMAQQPHTP